MTAHLSSVRVRGLFGWTLVSLVLLASGVLGSSAAHAGKAHEHGVVRLDVSIEGPQVTIDMTAALDNWLGFERTPRTDAERKAAAEVLARLRNPSQGAALFALSPQAQCQLAQAEVSAPVLEPAAKPAAPAAVPPPPAAKGGAEHADLEASYRFQCAQPALLNTLDLGLFDTYKRIQRIEVQVAGPKGQSKVTLRRPARSVALTR
ncbi:MAG: DUF2796 domain-containing protein [Betaproteobacteria bacterium]